MNNARSIQGIIVLVVGILLSLWLGISVATDQEGTIIKVVAVAAMIFCFALGNKIWLLIPFTWAVAIGLRIPGQPDTLLLGQLALIAFTIPQFALRKLPYQLKLTELELWMIILTLFIVQVYMRNPVGVNLFGGDTVGGKGYAIYAISAVSAFILAGLRVPILDLKWILRLSIIGGLINLGLSIIGALVPSIGYYIGGSNTRGDETNYENLGQPVDAEAATRISFLSNLGKNLSLWITSYISPILACVKPLWAFLVIISIVATLLGGFRNGLIIVGLTFILGIAYRTGSKGVLLSLFAGSCGLVILAIVNLVAPLPPNVQRALTFLPGTWEERYKDDASGSTEWRVEIWKEALLSDRWIQNKWLGDGLGFSAAELMGQMNQRKGARSGLSGFDAHRETVLVNGDYHSGPVSSVRVVGYIGLLFFVLAQIRLSVHAHRQIRRCKGTEWFSLALFIGIPLIYGPLVFIFIFGDFKGNAAVFLLSCGMIRLLQNNLPLPPWQRASYIPMGVHGSSR